MKFIDLIGPRMFNRWPLPHGLIEVVDINDAAAWLDEAQPEDGWKYPDMPCMLSPWVAAFYEWRMPKRQRDMNAQELLTYGVTMPASYQGRVGILVLVADLHDPAYAPTFHAKAALQNITVPPATRYVQEMTVHMESPAANDQSVPPITFHVMLDERGASCADMVLAEPDAALIEMYGSPYTEDFISHYRAMEAELFKVFFATSLLDSREVKAVPHQPTPAQVKHAAKLTKFGKVPPVPYHTVVVDGFRRAQSQGQSQGQGGSVYKALHTVRGHTKTYTAERPLFGRLTGEFRIPAHFRGAIDQGVTHKSYRVKVK
ncbi:hypothetical protein [Deinococcus kurensis]|uniref:hypothetical protein n=1 Tax=Deinococcus kurensis TaxID=2662757 RepID=UPI0012D35799|nr:hypothetical protein [Deinococcus kurensis]